MIEYQPFQYPPNYDLARLHKSASMPGQIKYPIKVCPCCNKKQKKPFKDWIFRSIDKDFKVYGGSVVTYFWLLKFYAFIVGFVIVLYSIYQFLCVEEYCNKDQPDCQILLGTWVISNQNLYKIIKNKGHQDVSVRLFTLRGIAFVVLLFANAFSLYIAKRFKDRYPQKIRISQYSLLFKNVKIPLQEFIIKLKEKFPKLSLKEAFKIKIFQPFYGFYCKKTQKYYQMLNEEDNKKKKKGIMMLKTLQKKCQQSEQLIQAEGDRVIVVFNSISQRNQVQKEYNISKVQRLKLFLDIDNQSELKIYCEQCPKPQEILWQNIGHEERQKYKLKILSVVYFFGLLIGSYTFLYFCMKMVYQNWFSQPLNTILINFILIFVVIVALTFRSFMNKLSDMRNPNTYTNRTMFIVITTVLFHFIYYIVIPTIYFALAQDRQKSSTLKMISNQTMNFVIVQVILAGFDIMHCCWNKRLKKVQNQQKPFGCQKVLHQNMEYPRFPIQFKLIILFKIWSFIIFFAFQVPLILFLIFGVLVFLLIKDKHSVYYHYRMEIIDNRVQFNFLRVYSNFFSIYMFLIFVFTQHLTVQLWLGLSLTIAVMLFQTFYLGRDFKQYEQINQEDGSIIQPPEFQQLQKHESYRKVYNQFVQRIQSDKLDIEIKSYLQENGYGSLKTQEFTESTKALI